MNIHDLIADKFDVVCNGTLPYVARRGTREQLAEFFGELGFKTGAEIGVRTGDYSIRLCRNNPGLKLKCVDPWTPFRRNSNDRQEKRYRVTCEKMAPYGAEIIRKTSVEAAKDIPDGSLDFIYVDALHEFSWVMLDLIFWNPKVRRGGIISGHDYTVKSWCNGVIGAVQAYTQAHDVNRWYITSSIGRGEDAIPSFFWVKT